VIVGGSGYRHDIFQVIAEEYYAAILEKKAVRQPAANFSAAPRGARLVIFAAALKFGQYANMPRGNALYSQMRNPAAPRE
jgi:hypothetical protein